jgi:cytochrome c-type biogenesis protein
MMQGVEITLGISFSAGLVSFFSPCVLPLIPSFITYITGLSFQQLQQAHPGARIRMQVAGHCLLFIAGFSVVYTTMGVLAGMISGSMFNYLQEGLWWIQKIGGVLIFLFGVHLAGIFHFGILLGEKRVQIHDKPAGYFGSFLVGLAFAAGWTPCIGPILGAVLAMAAGSSGGAGRGGVLLAAYSAGLGVPFLISGLLLHGFLGFFNRFRKYIRLVEVATGIMLMVVGVMLFFNWFSVLTGYLYQWLPTIG